MIEVDGVRLEDVGHSKLWHPGIEFTSQCPKCGERVASEDPPTLRELAEGNLRPREGVKVKFEHSCEPGEDGYAELVKWTQKVEFRATIRPWSPSPIRVVRIPSVRHPDGSVAVAQAVLGSSRRKIQPGDDLLGAFNGMLNSALREAARIGVEGHLPSTFNVTITRDLDG